MAQTARRSTIYFDPEVHQAPRLKAAATDRSVSDLVNLAVRLALAEDAEDLAALNERMAEPNLSFEAVVKALKADDKMYAVEDDESVVWAVKIGRRSSVYR